MARLLVTLGVTMTVLVGCGRDVGEQSLGAMPDSGVTSLQKTDVTVGGGAEARTGATVHVHYTGWLYDPAASDHRGKKFDSSKDGGAPFEFRLGAGEVIQGWDEGVAGMKVGGTRLLTVPPALGYGAGGASGIIPPNATLVFELELVDVR
jgi:FKBP-type peptidyl-prolyl cis-trans isomerase FkpA